MEYSTSAHPTLPFPEAAHRGKGVESEAALIALARCGDRFAVAGLLRMHRNGIERLCRKLCGADESLDDVLQETYLGIVRNIGSFRGESGFLTWVYTVARTYRCRYLRSTKRLRARESAAAELVPAESAIDTESHVAGRQLGLAIDRVLRTLPELDRQVLTLRDSQGLTAAEVAQQLGLSVPAVKTRLHRARAAARKALCNVHRDYQPKLVPAA